MDLMEEDIVVVEDFLQIGIKIKDMLVHLVKV